MMNVPMKRFFLLLLCVGLAAIAVAVTANVLGFSHHTDFGWKKTSMLLMGAGLCLISGFALSKPRTTDVLMRVVLSYGSFALLILLATAHRIHLGHNPALRWKKAFLLILSLALAGVAVSYKRQKLPRILGVSFACIGTSLLLLISFPQSLGLPQILDTDREAVMRIGLGITAILAAIFLS